MDISFKLRRQPSQGPVTASMRQTEIQGIDTESAVAISARSKSAALRSSMSWSMGYSLIWALLYG